MVATTAWTGASQSGKRPAYCSIRMPRKRSKLPKMARCSMIGRWRAPSSPTYSASRRSGRFGVDLEGAALPVAADGVAQDEFQFRAVEGALAGVEFVIDAGDGAGFAQGAFGVVPGFVAADARFRAVGEFDAEVAKAEVAVNDGQKCDEPGGFGGDLVLGAEDVGVILGEGAHPHDAVQRAGRLVAMAGAEFGHAQR